MWDIEADINKSMWITVVSTVSVLMLVIKLPIVAWIIPFSPSMMGTRPGNLGYWRMNVGIWESFMKVQDV